MRLILVCRNNQRKIAQYFHTWGMFCIVEETAIDKQGRWLNWHGDGYHQILPLYLSEIPQGGGINMMLTYLDANRRRITRLSQSSRLFFAATIAPQRLGQTV